jgi:hypothetical protein
MRTRTLSLMVVPMSVTLAAQQGPYKCPHAKQIEERADIFGFLVRELKIALPSLFGQK